MADDLAVARALDAAHPVAGLRAAPRQRLDDVSALYLHLQELLHEHEEVTP